MGGGISVKLTDALSYIAKGTTYSYELLFQAFPLVPETLAERYIYEGNEGASA